MTDQLNEIEPSQIVNEFELTIFEGKAIFQIVSNNAFADFSWQMQTNSLKQVVESSYPD